MAAVKRLCSIDGCGKPHSGLGWCQAHKKIAKKYGDPLAVKARRRLGTGCIRGDGYVVVQKSGVAKYEHVRVAEAALGKSLPAGAVVHHVDLNPSNNAPGNLVICPDDAYHSLLHKRQRAMDACGNPNWLRCCYCSTYSPPEVMHVGPTQAYHRACNNRNQREFRERRAARQTTKENQ